MAGLKTSQGFEMTGLNEAVRQLGNLADEKQTDRRIGAAMSSAAKPVLESAKSKVAVDPGPGGGTLKRSLVIGSKKLRNGNRSVRVGPDSNYVEISLSGSLDSSGTGQVTLGTKEKRPSRYAHLVEYGDSKTGPRSFMGSAGEKEGGDKYVNLVAKEVGKSIDRLIRKGRRANAK